MTAARQPEREMLPIVLDAASRNRSTSPATEYLGELALALVRRRLRVAMLVDDDEAGDAALAVGDVNAAPIRVVDMAALSRPIERDGAYRRRDRTDRARDLERVIEHGCIYHAVGACDYSGSATRANVVTFLQVADALPPIDLRPVDLVVATSASMARRLVERFEVPKPKILTSYPGVSPEFDSRAYQPRPAFLGSLGMGSSRRFILADDRVHAPDRIGVVLDVFAKLRSLHSDGDQLSLVLLGGEETREAVNTFTAQSFRSDVIVLNRVETGVRPSLYHHAEVFLTLNADDPFAPALEAMKSSCPIVCAEGSAASEAAQDCGAIVQADDPGQSAEAVLQLIEDPCQADALRFAALLRSDRFTWKRHVDDLVRAYEAF